MKCNVGTLSLILLVMLSSCMKISSQLTEASSVAASTTPSIELGSDQTQSDAGSGELKISITATNGKILVDVDKVEMVKEIVVRVNATDLGMINNLPFTYLYDPVALAGQTIEVSVTVLSMADLSYSKTSVIAVPAGIPVPTEVQPTDPVISANCLNEVQYDACIFYKNPVAHMKKAFTTKITYGDNLAAAQTYGVKITDRTDPLYLKNKSVEVYATSGVKAKLSATNAWKANYKDDFGVHKLVQVLSYYWGNAQVKFMKAKGGAFYAENKYIKIDAYNASVKNNAYWDGAKVVLGTFGAQEIALSSEVLLHEMGHANLHHASKGQIRITSKFCATKMGCIGAIHEGQADIHAFLFFDGDSKMSQTITNTLTGWADRNPANYTAKNLDYFFSIHSRGGEIHGMGTAYSTILWQIMKDAAMNRDDFTKLFTMHLLRLTSSSTFKTAKSVWLDLSEVHFNGKYDSVIEKYFTKMGVN